MGKIKNPFPTQIGTANILTADVTLGAAGAWTQIGSYTVPDGTAIMLGQGNLSGQDNARGRFYYDIVDDAAGAEDGDIRIEARNPNQTDIRILYQGTTVKGRSADADTRTGQIPFPENGIWVPENWTIRVFMNPAAAGDVVDVSACTFLMDVMKADYVA